MQNLFLLYIISFFLFGCKYHSKEKNKFLTHSYVYENLNNQDSARLSIFDFTGLEKLPEIEENYFLLVNNPPSFKSVLLQLFRIDSVFKIKYGHFKHNPQENLYDTNFNMNIQYGLQRHVIVTQTKERFLELKSRFLEIDSIEIQSGAGENQSKFLYFGLNDSVMALHNSKNESQLFRKSQELITYVTDSIIPVEKWIVPENDR